MVAALLSKKYKQVTFYIPANLQFFPWGTSTSTQLLLSNHPLHRRTMENLLRFREKSFHSLLANGCAIGAQMVSSVGDTLPHIEKRVLRAREVRKWAPAATVRVLAIARHNEPRLKTRTKRVIIAKYHYLRYRKHFSIHVYVSTEKCAAVSHHPAS